MAPPVIEGGGYWRVSRRLVGDRIGQHADLLDLDFDDVARLHEELRVAGYTDAGRRACHEHISGLQRDRLADGCATNVATSKTMSLVEAS